MTTSRSAILARAEPPALGLEGIVVAETVLSDVDGERGRLIIAGIDVEELALSHTFEQTVSLLWQNQLPELEPAALPARLAQARVRAFAHLSQLGNALALEDGMDALRAAVAHLPGDSHPADVLGALAVYACAWARSREQLPAIAPNPAHGHAQDVLAMLGSPHDAARVAALDGYLTTVIDHGLNASTFAARVVASTRSDLVSAVVAAIGALKGPLHGGAPGPVLDMLDAIGSESSSRVYLEQALARGERIMGMGHRIYRVRDPRALVLERAVERLSASLSQGSGGHEERTRARLVLARTVEREAEALLNARRPNRALRANVEFYTAILLEALGVPRALFTPLFAMSRAAGWIAHIFEQRARGRLIRPSAHYVGAVPALPQAQHTR